MKGEQIQISLRYACPCDAREVLQVSHTVHLWEGEAAFIEAARRLYKETIKEIEDHKK